MLHLAAMTESKRGTVRGRAKGGCVCVRGGVGEGRQQDCSALGGEGGGSTCMKEYSDDSTCVSYLRALLQNVSAAGARARTISRGWS